MAKDQQLLGESSINELMKVFEILDEITEVLNYYQESGEDIKDLGSAWHHVHNVLERYGKVD